jgi:hypothetical protein
MRLLHLAAILIALLCATRPSGSSAEAQLGGEGRNRPRLGTLMTEMQSHHFKLWHAGKMRNWDAARYEVYEVRRSFEDAATFYPRFKDVPIERLIRTVDFRYLEDVLNAIDAKDISAFEASFGKLTISCNECHRAAQVPYIGVRVPLRSPFGDQVYEPQH